MTPTMSKTYLKWAGGKHRIAERIEDALVKAATTGRCLGTYYEPMCGAASPLIRLVSIGRLQPAQVVGTDVNRRLIATHQCVTDPELRVQIMARLEAMPWGAWDGKDRDTKAHYYDMRERFNALHHTSGGDLIDPTEIAALFIWLNRHGFNGLYRENSSGGYNVPIGSYKTVTLPANAIEQIGLLWARWGVVFRAEGFATTLAGAGEGDWAYVDPPYVPQAAVLAEEGRHVEGGVGTKGDFAGYSEGGFDADDQQRLLVALTAAAKRGAAVVTTNHALPSLMAAYRDAGFTVETFEASRRISRRGDGRQPVMEMIAYRSRHIARSWHPQTGSRSTGPTVSPVIYNHRSARLSAVDMQMVRVLPQGGNWKDIPESIPSKRIEGIRASCARGEGSRSTYYGRLREEMPSYTINTYFNRPGNGCHVHPTQDRVISQREAARLQSFPDDFQFMGPQGAVNKQIGNAVPPLLAFQVARSIGRKAAFIDLFAGAGGMGLGFLWAGWTPIVANDIESRFLETYARNVHGEVVAGTIASDEVLDRLAEAAIEAKRKHKRLWVLGGPPCQGFSTAGKPRSMEDPRNHLAWNYARFLERVRPDGFVFENVTGLLNMQKGAVFASVREAFSEVMPRLDGAVLSADEYAIPQRRKRVFLVGRSSKDTPRWSPPNPITATPGGKPTLFNDLEPSVSVGEALSDLPPLVQAEDGSAKGYVTAPRSPYQALMRGSIGPDEYLDLIKEGKRVWVRDD